MKDHIKEKKENITIDDILSLVCKEFNIKPSDVKSNKNSKYSHSKTHCDLPS